MSAPVVVITPAYNAGRTIEETFGRIPLAARQRIAAYAIVNDGSTDDTAAALARLRDDFPRLTILNHPVNRGYGAAEKTLLRWARDQDAAAAVLLHADGQYAPEKIPELLEPLDRGAAGVVQGSRMLAGGALRGGMPLYKYLGNKALSAIESWGFDLALAEYHSGYLAYSRRVLDEVPLERLSDSFDLDIELMICAELLGERVAEIPIPTRYADEVSHLSSIRYGLDALAIVWRYRHGHYHRLLGLDHAARGGRR